MRNFIIFEPANLAAFGPLTLLRSVGELRYGIYSNLERAKHIFPEDQINFWVRPILAADHANRYPDDSINQPAVENTVFFNASVPAWIYPVALSALGNQEGAVISKSGSIIAARPGAALAFSSQFHKRFSDLNTIACDSEICNQFPAWIWDFGDLIAPALDFDLDIWQRKNNFLPRISKEFSTIDDKHIFIHNTAQVSKFVHLDSSRGPIIIDKDCIINSFCTLVGPLYIGKQSSLKPSTHIKYSVVGHICNLGGEIKGSIIHPNSNKGHDGFLGDSILGSWVNLGAGTTTSNLKNNYQDIRVSWDGLTYETNRQFLGAIIGDHSKTAIGVRLNTGTLIGPFCNVFQADFPPGAIPSFSWGNGTYELEKAIATARLVMLRRNRELTPTQESIIRILARDNAPFIHF
ncbi:hypothetical protein HQ531_15325 [bacterium]|nr:hypothetical protein [bacterium]